MATKKQKREAGLAKREKFLEKNKRLGLAAQSRDREARKRREQETAELLCEHNRQVSRALAILLITDL